MDWGNAIIREIRRDSDLIVSITAELHLAGDFKKTEKKITWIADVPESVTPVVLTTFDHLITKDKLDENDNFEDYVNHNSVSKVNAVGDINMRTLPVGSIIQFERKGYFRLDAPFNPIDGQAGEFFLVPDGKTVNRYGAKSQS
jgi:glutamyl-tRNA synthetase